MSQILQRLIPINGAVPSAICQDQGGGVQRRTGHVVRQKGGRRARARRERKGGITSVSSRASSHRRDGNLSITFPWTPLAAPAFSVLAPMRRIDFRFQFNAGRGISATILQYQSSVIGLWPTTTASVFPGTRRTAT